MEMAMFDPDSLITENNWNEYVQNDHASGITTYIKANQDFLVLIKNVIDTSTDFDSMKKELTNLYQERKSFVRYASDHLP